MKSTSLSILVLAAACAPKPAASPAEVTSTASVTLGTCVKAVQAVHAGTIVKVEGTTDAGKEIYEFDVRSPDGSQWDIECDAVTGQVVETEQEVAGADQEPFKAKVKVLEADARKTALAAHAGEIIEVEYEVESDGAASYEFDIRLADGTERKLEVDATSGQIVEDNLESFQIGVE